MPHKLLLADDSVTIQRVIELTFADEDVAVTAVGDGRQAIERIQADPPDIVLADVGMPEKDGYEVADFVKRDPRLAHIPVLLLTGAFEPVDEARAVQVGCDGVLAKPFEPQMVITRVRELLSATLASASRPTPRMIQPPPSLKTAPRPAETVDLPPAPVPAAPPPEPLPPPLPPPLSAGPTPIVPLPVVGPPQRREAVAFQPGADDAGIRREVEVRLPVGPPVPESGAFPDLRAHGAAVRPAERDAPSEAAAPPAPAAPLDAPPPFDAPPPVVSDTPPVANDLTEPVLTVSDPDRAATLEQTIEEAPLDPLMDLPFRQTALPADGRNSEEVAVESAIDAAIRIRRRPPVAVPEIGVPPRALVSEPEPGPATAPVSKADDGPEPAAKLDDYFDRLDAAFASRSQARDRRPPADPSLVAADGRPSAVPAEAPLPAVAASPPGAAAQVPLPVAPVMAASPPDPVSASSSGIAKAFAALLDAEGGDAGAGPMPSLFAPPSISPALREELVEQVTRRVLERLSDRVVRETVTDLVSRVTERLVREEIERLKTTIK